MKTFVYQAVASSKNNNFLCIFVLKLLICFVSFRHLNTDVSVQVVQNAQVKLGGKTKTVTIDQQNGAPCNFRKTSNTSLTLVTCAT